MISWNFLNDYRHETKLRTATIYTGTELLAGGDAVGIVGEVFEGHVSFCTNRGIAGRVASSGSGEL